MKVAVNKPIGTVLVSFRATTGHIRLKAEQPQGMSSVCAQKPIGSILVESARITTNIHIAVPIRFINVPYIRVTKPIVWLIDTNKFMDEQGVVSNVRWEVVE